MRQPAAKPGGSGEDSAVATSERTGSVNRHDKKRRTTEQLLGSRPLETQLYHHPLFRVIDSIHSIYSKPVGIIALTASFILLRAKRDILCSSIVPSPPSPVDVTAHSWQWTTPLGRPDPMVDQTPALRPPRNPEGCYGRGKQKRNLHPQHRSYPLKQKVDRWAPCAASEQNTSLLGSYLR